MSWFPVPERASDLELLAPYAPWTEERVFALLTGASRREWRHKVGVVGPRDGSAKTTTRLAAAEGWVFKTQLENRMASAQQARTHALSSRASGLRAALWHPEKVWAVMCVQGAWLGLTLCPELRTLRGLTSVEERLGAWISMLQSSLDAFREHGLGLDVNPANFGFCPGTPERLHYLDDELYPDFGARNVAGAIVARIPEEPELAPAGWRAWGARLSAELRVEPFSWASLTDEIRRYPLTERFDLQRAALLEALPNAPPHLRSARRSAEITCVLADVHGNAAALDAVLSDARAHGADSFLFLGDAVGYGPDPAHCIARLAELEHALFVRGNHDHAVGTENFELAMNDLARQCAQWTWAELGEHERAWLANLPLHQGEADWLAVHGAPQDPRHFLAYVYDLTYEDNLRHLREHGMALCFHGHTHVQVTHAELASGPTKLAGSRVLALDPKRRYLVNPGSVGQPRDGDPRAAYALWHRRARRVESVRVTYDLERTIAGLRAAGLPAQLERRLRDGA